MTQPLKDHSAASNRQETLFDGKQSQPNRDKQPEPGSVTEKSKPGQKAAKTDTRRVDSSPPKMPSENGDVGAMSIGQLLTKMKPSELWSVLAAIGLVVSGSFLLGGYLNSSSIDSKPDAPVPSHGTKEPGTAVSDELTTDKAMNSLVLQELAGEPLASMDEYPVTSNESGQLILSQELFMKAVHKFLENANPRGAADLVYLGEANNVILQLSKSEKVLYRKLVDATLVPELDEVERHKNQIFQLYKDIVNGIGETFSQTPIEIVLHDTRNPLKSIVALQNPISGRRLNDPTTNFGIQLIRDYSKENLRGSSFVSYALTGKNGHRIKSTTVPLFHDRYGLIGFVCMNIDLTQITGDDPAEYESKVGQFVNNLRTTFKSAKIEELINNSNASAD